MSIVMQELIGV